MINRFIKIYFLIVIMLGNFVMFAQGPGNDFEDDQGNLDDTIEDLLETPLNTKLIWLAVAGIAFAWYSYKKAQATPGKTVK